MIRLHVLGSGSKGNAFAVTSTSGTLLIEAGFSTRSMVKRLELAEVEPSSVRGIVLTHEHGDHARGGIALADRLGVPVACSPGTWRALHRGEAAGPFQPLSTVRPTALSDFLVHAQPTTHDAAQPLAVAIEVAGVRVGFVMDIGRPTTAVRYLISGCHAVVVESNYDELLLRTGAYPASVQARIAGSQGHLSNRAAADLLSEMCHPGLSAVVLAHLSQQSNTRERARETIETALRARAFKGTVWVADQDEPLPPIEVAAAPRPDQGELRLLWDREPAVEPRGG